MPKKPASQVFAIYRQLSPMHGWSLLTAAPDQSSADAVAESSVKLAVAQGHTQAEAKVVQYDTFEDVESSLA